MTKITIFKNHEQKFLGFTCLGHAGYAEEGEDIVCAGISTLTINTINSLELYTSEKFEVEAEEESGEIALRFDSPAGHDADLLMKSMVLGLQEIQKAYGNKHITLNFREV